MDGKLSPDVATSTPPHRSEQGDRLILTSRRASPEDRPRLIELGWGDSNVRDPGEEDLVLRSRRKGAS